MVLRGVICFRVVPAKFKIGMCEMKIFGSEVCSVSWEVGSGWVGTHAWCNMESCPGKVQKRCVRCKSWGLRFCGVSLEPWFRVGTHARCNLFRQSSEQACVR